LVYFWAVMLSKADKTRQYIIEKSAPIFNKKGYSATTMADILQATGLAKGGIYGNFSSKDEIAAEAFEYAYTRLKEELRFKIKQEKTARDKLFAVLNYYHNYTSQPHIDGGCPLLNTAIDADDNIPFLKKKAKAALDEMVGSLEYIISKGIEHGEFKKEINALQEAEIIFAMIEGSIMMSKLSDNPGVLNRMLNLLKQRIKYWKA
jgi:TetR/AcrR family transcriptional regulator, transcriptional repressor for nem operon